MYVDSLPWLCFIPSLKATKGGSSASCLQWSLRCTNKLQSLE